MFTARCSMFCIVLGGSPQPAGGETCGWDESSAPQLLEEAMDKDGISYSVCLRSLSL